MYYFRRTNINSVIAPVWNIWVLSIITPTDNPILARKGNRRGTEEIGKGTRETVNGQKCAAFN